MPPAGSFNNERSFDASSFLEDEVVESNPLKEIYSSVGAGIETLDRVLLSESADVAAVEVVGVGRSGERAGRYYTPLRETRTVEITPDEAFLLPQEYTVDLLFSGQDAGAYARCKEGDYYESIFILSDGATSVGNHSHKEIITTSRTAVSYGMLYALSRTSQSKNFEGPKGLEKIIHDVRAILPKNAGAATFTMCGIRKDPETGVRHLEYSGVGNDQITFLSETDGEAELDSVLIPADAAQVVVNEYKLAPPNTHTLTAEMKAARKRAIERYAKQKNKTYEEALEETTNMMACLLRPTSTPEENRHWNQMFNAFVNTGSISLEKYFAKDRTNPYLIFSTDTHVKDIGEKAILQNYARKGKNSPRRMAQLLDIAHWRKARGGFNNDSLAFVVELSDAGGKAETAPVSLEVVELPPSDRYTDTESLEKGNSMAQILNYTLHKLYDAKVDANLSTPVAIYNESTLIGDKAADIYRKSLAHALISTARGHYIDVEVEFIDEAGILEDQLVQELSGSADAAGQDRSFVAGDDGATIKFKIRRVGYTDKSQDWIQYEITASKIGDFPVYMKT